MLDWLRRALTKRRIYEVESRPRAVRFDEVVREEPPSDRFVLSIALMIVFFAGLVALEIVCILVLGEWSDAVFNGVMLVVGSLVGALFGYREAP